MSTEQKSWIVRIPFRGVREVAVVAESAKEAVEKAASHGREIKRTIEWEGVARPRLER